MALAVVLMVVAAWWVVRAPSIPRPVASAPEIDLDSGLLQELKLAQAAKAVRPPAMAGVHTPPAASSSPAASAPDERCGFEDSPQHAPGEMRDGVIVADQTKAAGSGWTTTQSRIDAALRASADPYDHAVADLVNVGNMRTPAGELDALVQAATTSSDARVYALAYRACYLAAHWSPIFHQPEPPASCHSVTARRWAALDPDNGVPWLAVLAQADEDNDGAIRQDALAHLAMTTRFDGHDQQAAAAILAHAPLEGANDLATHDLATQAWSSLNSPGLGPLSTLCKANAGGDGALAAQCAAIATTMFDHSDSWALRFTGASLTVYMTGDETRRKAARAERAALAARASGNMQVTPCGFLRLLMQQTLREGQIGDLAAMRERAASAPAKP
ncbi:MAG: hypothetical protein ABIR54_05920 [Burkholderiaceae bacterium]